MNVLVFGNEDYAPDAMALTIADTLRATNTDLFFQIVKPNEDLPFIEGQPLVILDVVDGIEKVTEITEKNIDQLITSPRSSAHEYDLGFQLRYLTKLGKIDHFTIVGIPIRGKVDYDSIQLIFRKLVAQDIQGS